MNKSYVVIAGGDVAQRREPLLHSLNSHRIWEAVADVLQLLVCCTAWHQEPVPVP